VILILVAVGGGLYYLRWKKRSAGTDTTQKLLDAHKGEQKISMLEY